MKEGRNPQNEKTVVEGGKSSLGRQEEGQNQSARPECSMRRGP